MKDTKTITKFFETAKKAANFRTRLYDKFDYVQLKQFPLFSERGTYVFEVK